MPTVREIARQAGVSITTVSRVLNNHPQVSVASRDRVLAVANQSRYVSKVGRRSTSNIAFVYTGEYSLGSPFDAALMQGMSYGMEQHDYDLMVLGANRSRQPHETYTQMLMRKGVRGAVLRTTAQTRDICLEFAAEGFPVVVLAEEFDEPEVHSVFADARPAVRLGIEHLLNLGHQRIAITLNIVDDHDHRLRLEAYLSAMEAAGIAVDDRYILRVPAYRDAGAVALRQIMSMPERPTAVFATDPMAAVGIFHEAQRSRIRIPEQLSVIGFDDADARFGVFPRMTAICQDAEALGREGFNGLQRLIEKSGQPSAVALDCWYEVHDSVAALAAQSRS